MVGGDGAILLERERTTSGTVPGFCGLTFEAAFVAFMALWLPRSETT